MSASGKCINYYNYHSRHDRSSIMAFFLHLCSMGKPNWDFFRHQLLEWYQPERRPMPWKAIENPYLIWLSEIILQQTRVEQGLPYYQRFVEQYPTVYDLAAAEDDASYAIGYNGAKRYVRVACTKTGTHTNGTPIGAVGITMPIHRPVSGSDNGSATA